MPSKSMRLHDINKFILYKRTSGVRAHFFSWRYVVAPPSARGIIPFRLAKQNDGRPAAPIDLCAACRLILKYKHTFNAAFAQIRRRVSPSSSPPAPLHASEGLPSHVKTYAAPAPTAAEIFKKKKIKTGLRSEGTRAQTGAVVGRRGRARGEIQTYRRYNERGRK